MLLLLLLLPLLAMHFRRRRRLRRRRFVAAQYNRHTDRGGVRGWKGEKCTGVAGDIANRRGRAGFFSMVGCGEERDKRGYCGGRTADKTICLFGLYPTYTHVHRAHTHTHLCTHTLTQLHRCDVASLYAQTIGAGGSCMAATLGSSVVRCPFVRLSVVRTTSESQRYGQKETRAERRDRERERGDESRPNAPWCTLKMRFFP